MPVPTQQVKLCSMSWYSCCTPRPTGTMYDVAAVLGIDRRQDVIEQRPLVEVGVDRVGPEREQPARELQHVVVVARLAGAAVDASAQLIGRPEVLGEAVTAGRVAVVLHDAVPEEAGGEDVAGVADVSVPRRRSDQLRDLTVAVLAGEVVLVRA